MTKQPMLSNVLTNEKMACLRELIQAFKAETDFSVHLTTTDRMNLLKLGDKSVAFVTKSLSYAKEYPVLVPGYVDVELWDKEMKAAMELRDMLRPLRATLEALDNSAMLMGSNAMVFSKSFYTAVKDASQLDVAGSTSIYADLRKRYVKRFTGKQEGIDASESTVPNHDHDHSPVNGGDGVVFGEEE